jgi:hypothetical protein
VSDIADRVDATPSVVAMAMRALPAVVFEPKARAIVFDAAALPSTFLWSTAMAITESLV